MDVATGTCCQLVVVLGSCFLLRARKNNDCGMRHGGLGWLVQLVLAAERPSQSSSTCDEGLGGGDGAQEKRVPRALEVVCWGRERVVRVDRLSAYVMSSPKEWRGSSSCCQKSSQIAFEMQLNHRTIDSSLFKQATSIHCPRNPHACLNLGSRSARGAYAGGI